MARKKKRINENEPVRPKRPEKMLGWVNVKIEESDTPEIEELLANPLDLIGELIVLGDSGFDIGVKWVDGGASSMAYIIGTCADDASGSVGLSAFGNDFIGAIACLLFKYHGKLGARLPAPSKGTPRRFG